MLSFKAADCTLVPRRCVPQGTTICRSIKTQARSYKIRTKLGNPTELKSYEERSSRKGAGPQEVRSEGNAPGENKKAEGDATEANNNGVYVSYMKRFNMISNAVSFETKYTDIDELHPSTPGNKVKPEDWVKDKEEKIKHKRVPQESSSIKALSSLEEKYKRINIDNILDDLKDESGYRDSTDQQRSNFKTSRYSQGDHQKKDNGGARGSYNKRSSWNRSNDNGSSNYSRKDSKHSRSNDRYPSSKHSKD
jgi:hypothetical protein